MEGDDNALVRVLPSTHHWKLLPQPERRQSWLLRLFRNFSRGAISRLQPKLSLTLCAWASNVHALEALPNIQGRQPLSSRRDND